MEGIDQQFNMQTENKPKDYKIIWIGVLVIAVIVILVFLMLRQGIVPISEKQETINRVKNLEPLTQEEKDRVDLMMQTSASPIDSDEKQNIINFTKNL